MLLLNGIKEWLKTFDLGIENFYIGKLDNKKEKSLGIYATRSSVANRIAIGGIENTSYKKKYVTLLVHYNKNMDQTETASNKIYRALEDLTNAKIGKTQVDYIKLLENEPISVDSDENGVYEMVINLVFYYRLKEDE